MPPPLHIEKMTTKGEGERVPGGEKVPSKWKTGPPKSGKTPPE